MLLLYLISLSAIRNAISISIVLLSFDLLFNGKVKKSLMIYPVSILFHTSALFFVPFFIVHALTSGSPAVKNDISPNKS